MTNIDKFNHLHEGLVEMSQYLRYKSEKDRIESIKENKAIFKDGIGDLFFGMCRLANQLDIDIEEAFNMVQVEILNKYNHKKKNIIMLKNLGGNRVPRLARCSKAYSCLTVGWIDWTRMPD